MYTVKIENGFRGHYKTLAEAMAYVEKWAFPWKKPWEIKDGYQKVVAKG